MSVIKRTLGRFVPRSIAARLSVLFALASALLLASIGVYLYSALGKELAMRNEEHLYSMTELARHVLDDAPSLDQLRDNPGLVTHLLVGHDDLRLAVFTPDRRLLLSSSSTPLPDDLWTHVPAPEAGAIRLGFWRDTPQSAYRLGVTSLGTNKPGLAGLIVLVTFDVSHELRTLLRFRNKLIAAMSAGLLLTTAIGLLIASRGLRPIVRIAESARQITASHLQERLDIQDAPLEVKALVHAFNTMLARLQDSFRRLSDFSADLAHELRTPLTNILGKTQVTLSKARSADDYRDALVSNVEEIENLSKLVSDMLFLAHADRADAALDYEAVDLRSEAERLAEFFSVTCEEREIEIAVSGEGCVRADRTMLRRAVANLLSNAIRHSPDGARIDVVIDRGPSSVRVSIVDRGPGIAPEHQARIFDRFYRADPSRARHSGGSGLGLAIVRSIALLHGGDVSVDSMPGKPTTFSISIPALRT